MTDTHREWRVRWPTGWVQEYGTDQAWARRAAAQSHHQHDPTPSWNRGRHGAQLLTGVVESRTVTTTPWEPA